MNDYRNIISKSGWWLNQNEMIDFGAKASDRKLKLKKQRVSMLDFLI